MTDEPLWTVADVKRELALKSKQSVYNLIPRGLPVVRIPGTGEKSILRFMPAEVRAFKARHLSHSLLEQAG